MFKWLFLLWIAVLTIGTFRGPNALTRYMSLRASQEEMSEVVNRLKEENKGLKDEIFKIKNSPDYARKVLRDKYHVIDKNERIIFFSE